CSESSYWLTDSRECGAKASPASRCLAGPANGPGQIAPYRLLVGVVQRAVFGAVPAVAVVLKLVVMPGDTRPLDCGTLVIIHMPSSPSHVVPRLVSVAAGSSGLSARVGEHEAVAVAVADWPSLV